MSERGVSAGQPGAGSGAAEHVRDAEALREHVHEIIASPAFKGSRRGQQFLQYVVEKVIAGHSDELKERTLGVDLFGRSPSYDTGEDAIVRVTASDVRKRLHHFYADSNPGRGFRIELPAGSYIAEFVADASVPARQEPAAPPPPVAAQASARPPSNAKRSSRFRVALWACVAALALAVGWLILRTEPRSRTSPRTVLPWSVLLGRDRPLQVILSDPDISTIQEQLSFHISLSDYANRRYVPESLPADAEIRKVIRSLHGVNVPFVDVGIALRVSELAQAASERAVTHNARSLKMDDFRTDENFVLLGSPRSNPWSTLFEDRLDFAFVYDEGLKQEIILNKQPGNGEPASYIPTAKGFETGQAFAIVALVANPGQAGKVLLLAGTNAEATDAAGRLAANLALLSQTLKQHGIDPRDQTCAFEILLRVRTLAGSPTTFEVIACHRLAKAAA